MAVHTGEADVVNNGNYQGVAIIRAARVRSFASGGQILLSSSTASLVADRLPEDCTLVDLGFHALKGLSRPERVARSSIRTSPAVGADHRHNRPGKPASRARGADEFRRP